MSSTTAGAQFGFALLGLIVVTNIAKYPFLRVGTRFTAVTGMSLLEGFQQRNPMYLRLYLLVTLATGTVTIAAVSFIAGVLLRNVPLLSGFNPYGLSMAVLVVSGVILMLGRYRALDRLSKLLVAMLTLLTALAAATLLIRGPVGDVTSSWLAADPSPWTLANLGFLIPLMGWMPGPVEMCVWPSLWMFSHAKDTQHTASLAEAEGDFNIGYGISLLTAFLFVTLGAYTMYGSGEGMLSGSTLSFAQKLIRLYTEAMGGWAAWVIIPAAFAAAETLGRRQATAFANRRKTIRRPLDQRLPQHRHPDGRARPGGGLGVNTNRRDAGGVLGLRAEGVGQPREHDGGHARVLAALRELCAGRRLSRALQASDEDDSRRLARELDARVHVGLPRLELLRLVVEGVAAAVEVRGAAGHAVARDDKDGAARAELGDEARGRARHREDDDARALIHRRRRTAPPLPRSDPHTLTLSLTPTTLCAGPSAGLKPSLSPRIASRLNLSEPYPLPPPLPDPLKCRQTL